MNNPPSFTGEQLATALHSLGVEFVMGAELEKGSLYKKPASLIAALAQSPEARLRLSLIPLFLEYPEFSGHVPSASKNSWTYSADNPSMLLHGSGLASEAASQPIGCSNWIEVIVARLFFPRSWFGNHH